MSNPGLVDFFFNDGLSTVNTGDPVFSCSQGTNVAPAAGNAFVVFTTLSDFASIHTDVVVTDTPSGDVFTKLQQANSNPKGGAQSGYLHVATNIASAVAATLTSAFNTVGEIEDYFAVCGVQISNLLTTGVVIDSQKLVQNGLAAGGNIASCTAANATTISAGQCPCIMVSFAMNTSAGPTDTLGTPGVDGTIQQLAGTSCAFAGPIPLVTCAIQIITTPGNYRAIFTNTATGPRDCICEHVILQGNSSSGLMGAALAGAESAPAVTSGSLSTGIALAAVSSSVMGLLATLGTAPPNAFSGANLTAPCAVVGNLAPNTAAMAAAQIAVGSVSGQLTNYASVVLSNSPWYSPGSIYDPNFWEDAMPVPGTVVFYDPTAIAVLPSGAIISMQNPVQALCFFNNGSGFANGTIALTPGEVCYMQAPCTVSASLFTIPNIFACNEGAIASVSGALSTGIAAAAALGSIASVSGSLSTGIQLAANLSAVYTVSPYISQVPVLNGSVGSVMGVTGALATKVSLVIAESAPCAVLGTLSAGKSMVGTVLATCSVAGNLTASIRFAAAESAVSRVQGALNTGIQLAGKETSLMKISAALATGIALKSGLGSVVSIKGALSTGPSCIAALSAPCVVSGTLSTATRFTAALSAPCTVTPGLFAQAFFSANLCMPCTVDPELTTLQSPVGMYVGDPSMTIGGPFQNQPTFLTFGSTEQDVVTFDFSPVLPEGVTLAGVANFTVENTAGSDMTPTDIIAGIGSFDITMTKVLVPINAANGILNNDYYVTCTCATTNPEVVLPRFAVIQIRG